MTAAELLSELTRLGIEVVASGDRLRYRPRSAVAPDLAAKLKMHKPELLALLRPPPEVAPILAQSGTDAPGPLRKPVCRCGSTRWRDVPIHNGKSVRRDCGKCGRFIEFPVWYGKDTLHTEQQRIQCRYVQETHQFAE